MVLLGHGQALLKALPGSLRDKRQGLQSTEPVQGRLHMSSHCHDLSTETAGKLPREFIHHRSGGREADCANTPQGCYCSVRCLSQ